MSTERGWPWPTPAFLFLLVATAALSADRRVEGSTNLLVLDTSAPFGGSVAVEARAGWRPVPTDLLMLEADPSKAASDPGYYGRDYSFTGDAVVENRSLTAVFWSARGRVVIYSKTDATEPSGPPAGSNGYGRKIAEVVPLQTATKPTTIRHCQILRNAGDQVALDVSFSAPGTTNLSAVFSFGKGEIVDIKPAAPMKGIRLLSPIECGIVPVFIGDDLIFRAAAYPSADTLCIPSENLFLGLLAGEDRVLVMTWPLGKQRLQLRLADGQQGKRLIESLDFENDGQGLYLAALGAPGIWHRATLTPAYLEKDVAIQWKRPFPATWKTQLSEAGVRTTFAFRQSKGQIWRGVPGSYNYPVWFDGDRAFYHLSKKVPPQDESIIYFLEGDHTPLSVSTPADILKATLGRQTCDALLDPGGRKLRTHHRRGSAGVRRACTCGCTEAIQAVFESGEEVEKKDYINEAVEDMAYFVQQHVARIDEYRRFADDTIKFLRAAEATAPDLKPFLDQLGEIARQIPEEYNVQKENMKSLAYAGELARKTVALTGRKDPHNLPAYLDLLKAWRDMGGAQDYVVAQCHVIARRLFQEAGYGCVNQANAVELAQQIRQRCRQCLRNPDGYEIWPNY